MFDVWIYKLICKDDSISDCYVGSTTNVHRRRGQHKSCCSSINSPKHNLKVYKFIREHGGWENWDLVVIEQIRWESKADKLLAERTAMECIGATLNVEVPGRSHKETTAAWRAENKDRIRKRGVAYRAENKDRIRKRMASWRAESLICECGIIHTRGNKARHLRSARHARLIAQI